MNWEAIGAIGEVTGAVAVVMTLLYLSIQIRQNTRMMDSHFQGIDLTSFNSIDESFSRFRSMIASNEEVADLWKRTKNDYISLDDSEKERADALAWEWLVIYQNMYHRSVIILGKDVDFEQAIVREMQNPGLRQWWIENGADRHALFPEFRQVVDKVIRAIA